MAELEVWMVQHQSALNLSVIVLRHTRQILAGTGIV